MDWSSTVTDHLSSRTCLGYAKTADILPENTPENLIELHEPLLEKSVENQSVRF